MGCSTAQQTHSVPSLLLAGTHCFQLQLPLLTSSRTWEFGFLPEPLLGLALPDFFFWLAMAASVAAQRSSCSNMRLPMLHSLPLMWSGGPPTHAPCLRAHNQHRRQNLENAGSQGSRTR